MSIEQYENPEKLILSSILNPSCSFGLTTDVEVKLIDVNQHNRKKLLALESELKEILDKVATAKYQKKAKPHRKERDTAKVIGWTNFFLSMKFQYFELFYFADQTNWEPNESTIRHDQLGAQKKNKFPEKRMELKNEMVLINGSSIFTHTKRYTKLQWLSSQLNLPLVLL